jgi:hypothetical protein
MMNIVATRPPNYDAIVAAFPWVATTRGVIFAWDMNIHNPDRIAITPSLRDHEEVHSIQQRGNPAAWWDKYLASAEFRFQEEVKAHICEYANFYQHHTRPKRRLELDQIAERLAGPLYGSLTSKAAALRLLKTGAAVLLASKPQEGTDNEP